MLYRVKLSHAASVIPHYAALRSLRSCLPSSPRDEFLKSLPITYYENGKLFYKAANYF